LAARIGSAFGLDASAVAGYDGCQVVEFALLHRNGSVAGFEFRLQVRNLALQSFERGQVRSVRPAGE
jgi:hypothetical protein